jgi:protein-ribulosamine 3-kinase
MTNWSKIIEKINFVENNNELYLSSSQVGGGDINSAYHLRTQNNKNYFIKINHLALMDMFIAEFEALNELKKCDSIRTPRPICYAQLDSQCFIAMEYLPLQHQGNHFQFGQSLAKMHKISQPQFGWKRDNTIGSTVQNNYQCDNWVDFWKNQRLIPQFELLYQKGHQDLFKNKAEQLLSSLDYFFQGHQPVASLLHGDLWSGNYAFDDNGNGVIFDPALYYGDRETDLAMTELFGGFSSDFYKGYQEEISLADNSITNYKHRKPMYNLYHILNHANLFGGSYIHQALSMMEHLNKQESL